MMNRFSIVLTVVLMCGVSANAALSEGLVAYFPFEGNVNEVSGNSCLPGVSGGGLTYADGAMGQAAFFDGVDDRILVIHDGSLNFDARVESYSVACFFNVSQLSSGGQLFMQDRYDHQTGANSPSSYYLHQRSINGTDFSAGLYHPDGGDPGSAGWLGADIPNGEETGKWHHMALVNDVVSGRRTLYVNGLTVDEVSIPYAGMGSTINSTGMLTMGAFDGVNGLEEWLCGGLDEVRIYDRALSLGEVAELSTVPEPTTMSLLALGGMAILRRRRGRFALL